MKKGTTIARGRLIAGGAGAIWLPAVVRAPARAAEFAFRYGNSMTVDDPINVRAVQMANDIKRESNGRLTIQVFPNSVLGSDNAMLEQVREGALQFSCHTGPGLSGVAPLAGIQAVPYAFKSQAQAVAAQAGDFGAAVRKEIALKTGFHVFPNVISSGFREITTSTHPIRVADDLTGFKMRLPAGTFYVSVYKALGAQVSVISLAEVYTALQTRLVDGQDNSYAIIESQRFFEVQKYLSVMDSLWSGLFFYCGAEAWKSLPPDLQALLEKNAAIYGKRAVADYTALNNSLADKLRRQGLTFNVADRDSFKARLAPWYVTAKQFFGTSLWDTLEKTSGKLG